MSVTIPDANATVKVRKENDMMGAEPSSEEGAAPKSTKSKKLAKYVLEGIGHIHTTFNNTIVTITDRVGNKIAGSSAGQLGFKGSKKSTPHAAKEVAEAAINKAIEISGLKKISVIVSGPGAGRESALREFGKRFEVILIREGTTISFNGCRPPKERRV